MVSSLSRSARHGGAGAANARMLPRVRLPFALSKRLTHRFHEIAARDAKGSVLLGASTFLCLALHPSPSVLRAGARQRRGRLVMLAFALGTCALSLSGAVQFAHEPSEAFSQGGRCGRGSAQVQHQNGLTPSILSFPRTRSAGPARRRPIVDGKQIAK